MTTPQTIPQPLTKTVVVFWIQLACDVMGFIFQAMFTALLLVGFLLTDPAEMVEADIFIIVLFCVMLFIYLCWIIFKAVVLAQLHKQKNWAWVAAIVISMLNCLSFLYIIFGVIGLIGLLSQPTQEWFKKKLHVSPT